jgi:hypothetical protein
MVPLFAYLANHGQMVCYMFSIFRSMTMGVWSGACSTRCREGISEALHAVMLRQTGGGGRPHSGDL